MQADGRSLDDKRNELLEESLLGAVPARPLAGDEHSKNNLPDLLARWKDMTGAEHQRPRTAQSFYVPKDEIVEAGYDLALNRYKEVVHAEVKYDDPKDIIAELRRLEGDIATRLAALEEMMA